MADDSRDAGGPRRKAAALRYDPAQDGAPRVVASGRGELAQRIIDLAREHGVPIQEDPALVGALVEVELNREIPPELYEAVARVLAFIYLLEEKSSPGTP